MGTVLWHFGTHKTGTTTFQSWLRANEDHADVNFCLSGHHKNPHEELSLLKENPDWFLYSIQSAESEGKILVISLEETVHLMNDSPSSFLNVVGRFNAAGHMVRVMGLLRRQGKMKESVYAQVAKQWLVGSIWEDTHYPLNYASWLLPLAKPLEEGGNKFDVRAFREGEDSLSTLVEMAQLRGGDTKGFPRANERLSRQKTLLLAEVAHREQKQRLFHHFEPRSSNVDYLPIMNPEERRLLRERFQDSNAKLSEILAEEDLKYLLDESSETEDWRPPDPLDSRDLLEAVRILGN